MYVEFEHTKHCLDRHRRHKVEALYQYFDQYNNYYLMAFSILQYTLLFSQAPNTYELSDPPSLQTKL